MPFLTITAIIIVLAYTAATQFGAIPDEKSEVKGETQTMSTSPSATSSATPNASPNSSPQSTQPTPKSSASSGESRIKIEVDTPPANAQKETFMYPGATGSGNHYETSASGEDVYNWYKQELEKRSYSIRNNVKTRANEKFKGVLQGVSAEKSFKVTIDQENSGAKTIITLE